MYIPTDTVVTLILVGLVALFLASRTHPSERTPVVSTEVRAANLAREKRRVGREKRKRRHAATPPPPWTPPVSAYRPDPDMPEGACPWCWAESRTVTILPRGGPGAVTTRRQHSAEVHPRGRHCLCATRHVNGVCPFEAAPTS